MKRWKLKRKPLAPADIPKEFATSEFRYRLGAISDKGRVRANNEDATLVMGTISIFESVTRARILCAVADGVGGSEKGEVASRLTLQTLADRASKWMPQFDDFDPSVALKAAVEDANGIVTASALENPERQGMASTIVVALIDGNSVYLAHVGDSRAYLIRKLEMIKLTKDHSQVQELIEAGEITAEEAENYPGRNVITRAVGVFRDLQVDLVQETISAGDTLLLCTDGLWDLTRESEIHEIVKKSEDPQIICRELVSLANERGGKDNISIVIVHCESTGAPTTDE